MPVDPSDIYAGYVSASRIAPVDRESLVTAFKPYAITLTSLKGKTDSQLRSMAAAAVLAKFRARKAAAIK